MEPADGLVEVGPADDESFRAAGEHDAGAARVDRAARGADPLDRELEVEQRSTASPVESSIDSPAMPVEAARATLAADVFGRGREAAFEVGVDRHVDAPRHRPQMGQHVFE